MKKAIVLLLLLSLTWTIGCNKDGSDRNALDPFDFIARTAGFWVEMVVTFTEYDTVTTGVDWIDLDTMYIECGGEVDFKGGTAIKEITYYSWGAVEEDYYVAEDDELVLYDDELDNTRFVLLKGPIKNGTNWRANPDAVAAYPDMRSVTDVDAEFEFDPPVGDMSGLLKVHMTAQPTILAKAVESPRIGDLFHAEDMGILHSNFTYYTRTGKATARYDFDVTDIGTGDVLSRISKMKPGVQKNGIPNRWTGLMK